MIEACEDIERGDQIYDSYGKKCNTRFLLNYGFINLNNDGNEFPFKIALDEINDPLFSSRSYFLASFFLSLYFRFFSARLAALSRLLDSSFPYAHRPRCSTSFSIFPAEIFLSWSGKSNIFVVVSYPLLAISLTSSSVKHRLTFSGFKSV